jgi:uncharacterized protein (TIGR02246 family)
VSAAEDELAILRALNAYCLRCDDGDFVALAEQFTTDGTFVFRGDAPTGRDALARWFEEHYPPSQRGKHLTINPVVEFVGDRATAVSDFLLLRVTDGNVSLALTGRYRDTFVKTDGRWLIERRAAEPM